MPRIVGKGQWGARIAFAALALALAVGPVAARADVTVERYMKSGGIAGIGAMEGTAVEKLSGLRKREVVNTKMTGFLGKMAGDMGGDTITDIAKDVVWKLDHKKKTYTEEKITPPPAPEEKQGKREKEKAEKSPVRIVRNEITVKELGDTKTIGEFSCAHYVVTWLLETENVETKERSESTMTTDLWNTAETSEIKAFSKEEQEFMRAWLKKVGWEMSQQEMRQFGMTAVASLFGGDEAALKKGMEEVAEKMKKVKGYPVGVGVKWSLKGSGGAEGAKSGSGGGSPEGMPDLAKGFGGLMAAFGKKGKGGGAAESGGSGASGGSTLFDTYTEIRSLSTSGIPDNEFSVPAGYQKVD
jgi:hypothetical protein